MIATNVGGIPEIFGPYRDRLIPCDDADRLADAMLAELARDEELRRLRAESSPLSSRQAFRSPTWSMPSSTVIAKRSPKERRHGVAAHAIPVSS